MAGSDFDAPDEVEGPIEPTFFFPCFLEEAVVIRLGAGDVAAEVEYGDVEQLFPLEDEKI